MAILDTLLYLAAALAPLVLAYALRKRIVTWFSQQLARSLLSWAFVTKTVQKEGSGEIVEIKALSAQAAGLLAAILPALVAWAKANVKFNLGGLIGSGLPAGLDMSKIGEALPQLIMMAPGKRIDLGIAKVPKELAAGIAGIFGPMLQGFLPGGKKDGAAKSGTTLSPEAQKIVDEAMK